MKESMGTVYGDLSDNTRPSSPAQKNNTNNVNRNTSRSTVSLSPVNSNVRELIKQWLSIAEPPLNAKGAQLRYDKWGRVYGRSINNTIRLNGSPDGTYGRTPEQYVWGFRTKLDSVNHCILGDYVQLRLNNKSISKCKGRYKIQRSVKATTGFKVSEVIGKTYKNAVSKLKAAGLIVLSPELGSPAKQKRNVGTIERIRKLRKGKIKRGDKVIPVIYGEPLRVVIVPGVVGVSVKKATQLIKQAGLNPRIVKVKERPNMDNMGKVKWQKPLANKQVTQGNQIILYYYPFNADVVSTFVEKQIQENNQRRAKEQEIKQRREARRKQRDCEKSLMELSLNAQVNNKSAGYYISYSRVSDLKCSKAAIEMASEGRWPDGKLPSRSIRTTPPRRSGSSTASTGSSNTSISKREREKQEAKEKRKYCDKSLRELNTYSQTDKNGWRQSAALESAYSFGCSMNEIRQAEKGRWTGGRTTSQPKWTSPTSYTGKMIFTKDPNAPKPPLKCSTPPGLFGAVTKTYNEADTRCMSDREYERAINRYKQRLREYKANRKKD